MQKWILNSLLIFFLGGIALGGCQSNNPTPKPEGYPRIKLPERGYQTFDSTCPFKFKYPTYGQIVPDSGSRPYPCWMNVSYEPLGARLYLSYRKVGDMDQLNTYREDAREFVYKHTVKASNIQENRIMKDSASGIFYELGGNTATAIQFFLTDSSRHFLRGSLYFRTKPNRDSLEPAIQFIKADIKKMIESLEWKKVNDPGLLDQS